jgi:hypothetical protein
VPHQGTDEVEPRAVEAADVQHTAPAVASRDESFLLDLARRSAERDKDAFSRLYELTNPFVYALLQRLTTSPARADDALVCVYITAWRRATSSARPPRSVLAWLTSIAFEITSSPSAAASG